MTDQFVPAIVQKMVDDLTRDTAVAPVLRHQFGYVHLTHENDVVKVTITYKLSPSGKGWKWHDSTLFIDGVKQARLADGYEHYLKIFKLKRLTELEDEDPFEPVILEPLEPMDLETAPVMVQKLLKDINRGLARVADATEKTVIRVGTRPGETEPVLEVETEKGTIIRIPCGDAHKTQLQVVRWDGKDLSAQFAGVAIPELMKLLAGATPEVEKPTTIGRTRQTPDRPNSVVVRRTTVIRV